MARIEKWDEVHGNQAPDERMMALCCGSGCYRERHHRNGGGIAAVRRREVHR